MVGEGGRFQVKQQVNGMKIHLDHYYVESFHSLLTIFLNIKYEIVLIVDEITIIYPLQVQCCIFVDGCSASQDGICY